MTKTVVRGAGNCSVGGLTVADGAAGGGLISWASSGRVPAAVSSSASDRSSRTPSPTPSRPATSGSSRTSSSRDERRSTSSSRLVLVLEAHEVVGGRRQCGVRRALHAGQHPDPLGLGQRHDGEPGEQHVRALLRVGDPAAGVAGQRVPAGGGVAGRDRAALADARERADVALVRGHGRCRRVVHQREEGQPGAADALQRVGGVGAERGRRPTRPGGRRSPAAAARTAPARAAGRAPRRAPPGPRRPTAARRPGAGPACGRRRARRAPGRGRTTSRPRPGRTPGGRRRRRRGRARWSPRPPRQPAGRSRGGAPRRAPGRRAPAPPRGRPRRRPRSPDLSGRRVRTGLPPS